jgi:hypothetical protein
VLFYGVRKMGDWLILSLAMLYRTAVDLLLMQNKLALGMCWYVAGTKSHSPSHICPLGDSLSPSPPHGPFTEARNPNTTKSFSHINPVPVGNPNSPVLRPRYFCHCFPSSTNKILHLPSVYHSFTSTSLSTYVSK